MLSSSPLTVLDLWQKDADPFISSLFGTENPLTFLTVVAGMLFLIKKSEQQAKLQKEESWVKPTLLILYGLNFGVNGAGFLMALAANDSGKDCFRCLDRNNLTVISISVRYLGYAYVCTLLFELWMKTLEAKQGNKISNARLFGDTSWLLVTYVALKFVPVGYYAFCPLLHCLLRTFDYGIKVLQSASPELNFISSSWVHKMKNIEILLWTLILAQQYWVYSSLQCDRSWANLMGAAAAGIKVVIALKS